MSTSSTPSQTHAPPRPWPPREIDSGAIAIHRSEVIRAPSGVAEPERSNIKAKRGFHVLDSKNRLTTLVVDTCFRHRLPPQPASRTAENQRTAKQSFSAGRKCAWYASPVMGMPSLLRKVF